MHQCIEKALKDGSSVCCNTCFDPLGVTISTGKRLLSLTDQNHQTGPLIGPLLVAGHLFISLEVGVSRIRALSGGSLPVLTTQPETSP